MNRLTPLLLSKKSPSIWFDRGLKISAVFGSQLSDEFPIKWTRPEKLKFYDPRVTGDLKPLPPLPLDKLPKAYEDLEEMKDAHPLVKLVFSCGHQGRRVAAAEVKEEMLNSVKAHEFDTTSMEAKIARLTFAIRNIQDHLYKYGNNPIVRKVGNHAINKRKEYLCKLREYDYKKFEWLLEKLDLEFKPHPLDELREGGTGYIRIERKESIRKLTTLHCEDILKKKWLDYEEQLENEKRDFLKRKVDTLKWARQEQIDCKMEPTISEEDIKNAEIQLEEFLKEWYAKEALKPVPKVRK